MSVVQFANDDDLYLDFGQPRISGIYVPYKFNLRDNHNEYDFIKIIKEELLDYAAPIDKESLYDKTVIDTIYDLPTLDQIMKHHLTYFLNEKYLNRIGPVFNKCKFQPLLVRNDGLMIVRIIKLKTVEWNDVQNIIIYGNSFTSSCDIYVNSYMPYYNIALMNYNDHTGQLYTDKGRKHEWVNFTIKPEHGYVILDEDIHEY